MEKYKILDKKVITSTNEKGKTYRYLIQIQCNDCGQIRWVNASDKYYKKGICKNCRLIHYRNQVLNIENENFKVIGIDEESTKENSRHTKYFVLCKKCGKIFSRRASVIRKSLESIQCSNCRRIRNNKPLNALTYKEYCHYRTGAKARNLDWNLSEEEFAKLIKGKCKYCGSEPNRRRSVSYRNDYELVNGVDRIDSNKGYSIDNCVSCCSICNRMKNDLPKDIFLEQISKIYNNSVVQRLS